VQTLVMVHNPPDIGGWSEERRIARWERVMEWHDYAARLQKQGRITHAWGAHALTDAEYPSPYQHLLIAIYSTADHDEFDDLREQDPLLDVSEYLTVPLVDLERQYAADLERLGDLRARVLRPDDPVNARVFAERRAVTKTTPPDFFGRCARVSPANPPTDLAVPSHPGDPLTVLLYGVNPSDYVNNWDDMTRLLHAEKVMWWHDYIAMLGDRGHVTHAWGCADFTSALATSAKTGGNVAVFQARDFEEFDGFYRIDPLRTKNLYISVALRPIPDQRESDRHRLELARRRAAATFA
jgi:hypothetical protein